MRQGAPVAPEAPVALPSLQGVPAELVNNLPPAVASQMELYSLLIQMYQFHNDERQRAAQSYLHHRQAMALIEDSFKPDIQAIADLLATGLNPQDLLPPQPMEPQASPAASNNGPFPPLR